jgi:hypothetical protein
VADKPIIKIEVDSEDFDVFADKFNAYREHLKNNPEAWASVNKEIGGVKNAFESAGTAFDRVQKGAKDPAVPRAFDLITKNAKASEKSWGNISKEIEKSSKFMQGLVRGSINFSAFGGLAGAIGGLGATIFGSTLLSASSVAAQNSSSRGLGLELGKESAFNTFFKRFGLNSNDLESMENAKEDVTQQTPLLNAGITSKQINSEDAEELQFDFAKRVGKQYSEWEKTSPAFALTQAQAFGYTNFYSPDQMRNLGSYANSGELDKAQDQFNSHWKEMGVSQSQADEASAFDTHQAANFKEIETAFDAAVIKLTPALDRWSDAATKLSVSLIAGAANLVDAVASPPHKEGEPYAPGVVGGFQKAGDWIWDNVLGGWKKNHTEAGQPEGLAPSAGGATSSWNALLDSVKGIESDNNPNAENPNSHAKGAYQLMDDTAKQYGVDPFDEKASRGAAQKLLQHDLAKFGDMRKALAAYDWGEGNLDKDINGYKDKKGVWHAGHGDQWDQFLPKETSDYLNKYDAYGVDLNLADYDPSNSAAQPATQTPTPTGVQPATQTPNHTGVPPSAASVKMTEYANYIKSLFREGGGNQIFGPRMNNDQDAPRKANNTVTPQQNIGVTVNTAPGADVSVTGASLVQ